MPVVTCPQCDSEIKVPNDTRGEIVWCQKCNAATRVPVWSNQEEEEKFREMLHAPFMPTRHR